MMTRQEIRIEKLTNQVKHLTTALEELIKLEGFYAKQLNARDGGNRIIFSNAQAWIMRLQQTGKLP